MLADTWGSPIQAILLLPAEKGSPAQSVTGTPVQSVTGSPVQSVAGSIDGLLGYSREDFLAGRVCLADRLHKADVGLFAQLLALDENSSVTLNLRLRHADNRIRCVQATGTGCRAGQQRQLQLLLQDARTLFEPREAGLAASFCTLIRNTRDIVYVKNQHHVYLAASQAFTRLTESAQSPADVHGKTDYDLFPETVADLSYQLEQQAFAEGHRTNQVQERKAQHGSLLWIDDNKYPLSDAQGVITGILGIAPDCTNTIRAQSRLLESEESLRDAQRIAGVGSFQLDLRTRTWKVSAEMRRILGTAESYDRNFSGIWPLIHPDDRPGVMERLEGYFRGGAKEYDREYRIVRHNDAAVRWIHTRGRIKRDPAGRPIMLRGTAMDVTEKKQAEAALRESEATLREAQRIAGLGSYTLDAQTGQWLGSESLDGVLGIDQGFQRTRAGWLSLIHPDDRERMATQGDSDVENLLESFTSEYRIIRPGDQAVRWILAAGRRAYDAEGNLKAIRGTLQDITERKQAECALRESKDLLQLFIDHAPAAIAMFDRDMRYVAASRRWMEICQLEGEELIGRPTYEVMPQIPDAWRQDHQRVLAGEVIQTPEALFSRNDGEIQCLHRELRPWRSGDGHIGGVLIFVEDITARKQAEAELRESRELLQLFTERAPAALAMFDRQMRYLAVSRRWREEYLTGKTDFIGRSYYEMIPGVPEHWREAHRRGLAGETLKADEERFERPDGSVQWIRREVVPWKTADGSVGGIVLFAEDVTAQRKSAERLRLAATVFTHAAEGICITDADANILEVNEAFTRITGYTRAEVLGKNIRILQSSIQSNEFYETMWLSLLKNGHWKGEIWNRNKNGEIFAEDMAINAIRDAEGKTVQYVALFSDVTQLKERERQLEHMAQFDALTGLPNRSLLIDRLRQGMAQVHRRKQHLAVATLDLDGFKALNDKYGHDVGDRLLTALAQRLRLALREGDTLARLSGDEFALVLMDLQSPDDALPVLNRLLRDASDKVRVGRLNLRISASIGVAAYPQAEDADAEQLLRQAGQALFEAKVGGRNRYSIFNSSQDLNLRGRNQELDRMRSALAHHEFVLHYQPKVNMRSGVVVGAEALIRWQHPERGLVPPGAFLPLIENDLFSVKLGEWVIESALQQIETWQKAGLQIPVSVNVGALQLQQKDFPERLRRLLAMHPAVKPSSLELEVLETSALQDLVQASNVLDACHAMGVSFAIDDFGTGYASLTYLKRLPAQTLKIDQSFVRDMLDDPENPTILEGVLGLATAFRRNAVAEGVETVEHGWMLLQLGCEVAQGYGIARPMPAHELPAWIESWRPDPRWTQSPPVHSGNRTLLFACVEHRAWLGAFESYLRGKRHAPPALDPGECRFGAWLEGERLAGRADLGAFAAIETLHAQLHALAAEILASQSEGHNSDGLARLSALHGLGHEFLEQLTSMN